MSARRGIYQARPILIGAAVLLSLGMGMRQSLGLFLTPLTRDLALTAADFTLAVAIQNIVWGISQAPVGAIADRFGLRITMIAGAAIYVLGLLIMAAAGGALALVVSGGFIGVALSCTASSLAMTACARAVPEQRRSKMLGVVAAAGSLGTLLVPLTTQSLLTHQAWQIGVLFFAALAAVMLPAAFWAGGADRLTGSSAAKTSMREMIGQAARHRPFLVMSGAYFVCGLNLVFLATHLPTYLALCGQDPMLSAEAIAVIGGMNAIGSLVARRQIPEAYPAGTSLHPARAGVHRLFRYASDAREQAYFRSGNGHAVAERRAARQRPRRRNVRHPIHGDLTRDRLCHASGRIISGGLGRRADL
jgi:MFS family permease